MYIALGRVYITTVHECYEKRFPDEIKDQNFKCNHFSTRSPKVVTEHKRKGKNSKAKNSQEDLWGRHVFATLVGLPVAQLPYQKPPLPASIVSFQLPNLLSSIVYSCYKIPAIIFLSLSFNYSASHELFLIFPFLLKKTQTFRSKLF